MKKKIFNISSIVFVFLLLIIIIIESIFIGIKNNESKIEPIIEEDFSWVEPEEYSYEDLIDVEKSYISLSVDDLRNFSSAGTKFVSTDFGSSTGISTMIMGPELIRNGKILNLENASLFTPYYNEYGKIDSYVSSKIDEEGKPYVYHWDKDYGHYQDYILKNLDHELIRYKNKDYILNGSKIWINSNSNNSYFNFSTDLKLGLPYTKDRNGEWISTPGGYHFNSFDIYGENLLINSRDFGTIFSLKILNEDGTLKSENDFELNWVLCGNSITPWYIDSYEDEDGNVINPIISNGNENDVQYLNYDHNSNYVPHIFDEWENKLLKIEIDGIVYDFTNIEESRSFNELDNEHKFWGAHTIRVINSYLDSVSENINGYDSDKLYISIHDNHFPSDVVFKYQAPEGVARGMGYDPYSFHANEEQAQLLFGNNPYDIYEDMNSYTKIYEIDPTTMIAKEVLNRNNTVRKEINHFSDYRSSSTFFSINENSYLITDSSMGTSFTMVAFDGIDFESKTLVNERLISDVQWKGEAAGYKHYRAYPIFDDITNVVYGWNVLNINPYMG